MGEVVHPVEIWEKPRMVHQPVRPIKVSVVQENSADNAAPKPSPAVITDAPIDLVPTLIGGGDGAGGDDGKDHNRQR